MVEPPAKSPAAIPESITTPDRVESRLGVLEFFDGLPTSATADLLHEHLAFMRGVEAFVNGVPAASLEALRRGMVSLGAVTSQQCVIFDQLMDSNPLFLTGNTDTVYASVILDLGRDGATVVEVPRGCGPGTVNDAWFRFVVDMGAPGPDQGRRGRYLILPPDHDGDVPEGYFTVTSPSYTNWLILRGLLVDGRPDTATGVFRAGLRVYPLAAAADPPVMQFVSGSGRNVNTIHANDATFYEELHSVVDREHIDVIDAETRGLLASVGIRKGRPFAPDERMAGILKDAADVGSATARSLFFRPRDPDAYIYDDGSHWKTGFVGGDYRWLTDDGAGGRNLDARTYFFYVATVNTPAMALKMVGVGSQYAILDVDRDNDYLDGARTYRLTIPADPPAKDFWSVVAYDPQSRSELRTSQPYPSKNSAKDDLDRNDDGSVDLYFGPSAPDGHEANWIQTVPGKGWFIVLRLYGPLEPWFDQTWRPGELDQVD